MDDYPPLSLAEDIPLTRLFLAFYPGSTAVTDGMRRGLMREIYRDYNPSKNNLILPPSKPASPGIDGIGVKARFWNKDLKPSKHPNAYGKKEIPSKAQERRAQKSAEDEAAKAEARQKRKTAYSLSI